MFATAIVIALDAVATATAHVWVKYATIFRLTGGSAIHIKFKALFTFVNKACEMHARFILFMDS